MTKIKKGRKKKKENEKCVFFSNTVQQKIYIHVISREREGWRVDKGRKRRMRESWRSND